MRFELSHWDIFVLSGSSLITIVSNGTRSQQLAANCCELMFIQ